MPELPEVEVVKQGLERILLKQPRIVQMQFLRPDLRDPIPQQLLKKLEGAKILRVRRRAKYLIFETQAGGFLSHLGMTGAWRRELDISAKSQSGLHDHIRIFLDSAECLIYHDPRRFGIFDILNEETQRKRFAHLGPEPLSKDFTGLTLWQSLRGKSVSLKAAIMDQKIVVGVGNIYASEALFLAKIKPQIKAHQLSKDRAHTLVQMIQAVLERAIAAGGSTISDYSNAEGRTGYFQNQFKVYDRGNKPCHECGGLIKQAVIAGRSTYWCSKCQA